MTAKGIIDLQNVLTGMLFPGKTWAEVTEELNPLKRRIMEQLKRL